MSRLVLLLEEESMRVLLDGLLPRLLPDLPFKCVPHEGKSDLARSIRLKLRAWREPGVRFAVVEDNDGKDCHALKDALRGFCEAAGRPDTLIRIACQELEAWYLGEPEALADAFGDQSTVHNGGHGAEARKRRAWRQRITNESARRWSC